MYTDMPVDRDYFHRSGYSATYTQSLTKELELKIVGAYREGHGQQFINFAESDENLFQVPGRYHDQQSSGEAQLTFTNDLVKAVGGAVLHGQHGVRCLQRLDRLAEARHPDLRSLHHERSRGCVHTKSTAVYGDTAWKITDQLNLDAGLRWNEDKKTASVFQADYGSLAPTQLQPNQQFFNPAAVPAGFFLFPDGAAW